MTIFYVGFFTTRVLIFLEFQLFEEYNFFFIKRLYFFILKLGLFCVALLFYKHAKQLESMG